MALAFVTLAFAGLLMLTPSALAARTVPCEEAASGGLNQAAGQCVKFKKARLINGMAIAPTTAPPRVKAVIEAANKIRNKPYRWGGGHGSFEDTGYDCSGAISYALKGGNFVTSPLNSSGYMTWGKSGVGRWITVYTNPGHAYLVVAGLRFDTSMTPGDGPGWSKSMRSTSGSFLARSPVGF